MEPSNVVWLLSIGLMSLLAHGTASDYATANYKFATQFYDQIRNDAGNIFFSPISIQSVLGMVYTGSGGATATQLRSVGDFPESTKETAQYYGALDSSFKDASSGVTLNFANGMYADKSLKSKPEFLSLMQDGFKSDLNKVDFSNSNEAINEINGWVSERTNGKIPKLFAPGSLDQSTRLVLLNAIYFKGDWEQKFNVRKTNKDKFHLNEKESVDVDFMGIEHKFKHVYDSKMDADVVEIPYKGETVSMVIVVPRKIEGLSIVEQNLKEVEFPSLLKEANGHNMILKLPKFKLQKTLDLKDKLTKMGANDIFVQGLANLTGIADENLFVGKAVQKTFIEVNEEGSEAAAATGFGIVLFSAPTMAPPKVVADRPFLFAIISKPQNSILFMGRLVK